MGEHSAPEPATKPQPVLIAQGVLAGLAFIFGGLTTMAATTGNEVLALIGGLGTLFTGGANIAVGFIVQGQVVPLQDVAAYVDTNRRTVAGPASPIEDGVVVKLQGSLATDGEAR